MTYYLTEKELLAINYSMIRQFSPTEDFGVKDSSALKAVVAQPRQNGFGTELYPTIYDKAAILFEMCINKYCFFNGNKRTAVMALYVFLRKNGVQLTLSNKEIADYAVYVAVQKGENRLTNEDISKWIEMNSRERNH
ncbi:type II toxin-antitoxin system death-on-curing family toxin [Alkalibacterium sp. MB6]|uniref:type II toxin-antitoxin system death-on-curing family toxin n=1 Tax=Alkalibacterium sp. MB6 TaxID=2081965 RepID=UPI0013797EB0|nr:type II toxin-antitoxin system death-on-curing family toxin [Alkalibacterium sp. MB6]